MEGNRDQFEGECSKSRQEIMGAQTTVTALQLSGWGLYVFWRQSKRELLLVWTYDGRETEVKDDSSVLNWVTLETNQENEVYW